MKKTLIALTLASLSAAAVADVTIYGNIRAGFYNHSNKAAGETLLMTSALISDLKVLKTLLVA